MLVLAVPHQFVEDILADVAPREGQIIVSLLKGVYYREGDLVRVSSVVHKLAPACPFAYVTER